MLVTESTAPSVGTPRASRRPGGRHREREREREREISKTANFEVGESHHPYVLLRSDSFSSSETFEVVSASDTSAKAETAEDAIFPDDYFLKKNIH